MYWGMRPPALVTRRVLCGLHHADAAAGAISTGQRVETGQLARSRSWPGTAGAGVSRRSFAQPKLRGVGIERRAGRSRDRGLESVEVATATNSRRTLRVLTEVMDTLARGAVARWYASCRTRWSRAAMRVI